MKTFKATSIDGTVFPALMSESGILYDSRTGEKAFADKWEAIGMEEFDALCDAFGLE